MNIHGLSSSKWLKSPPFPADDAKVPMFARPARCWVARANARHASDTRPCPPPRGRVKSGKAGRISIMSKHATAPATAPAHATDRVAELVALTDGIAVRWSNANDEKGDARTRARARVVDSATVVLATLITDGGAWHLSARVSVRTVRKDRGDRVEERATFPCIAVLRAIVTGAPLAGTTRLA